MLNKALYTDLRPPSNYKRKTVKNTRIPIIPKNQRRLINTAKPSDRLFSGNITASLPILKPFRQTMTAGFN